MMHHINRLPVINGFEAIKEVRKKLNSDIPIIALTADVTVNDLEKCKEVGINDHIAKPIDEKRLYNKIIELVKKDETKKNII
jgi:CheY-like chemotaxis protein